MAKRWMILLGAVLVAHMAVAQEPPALTTQKEKVSYALGMDLGNQLRKATIEVDPAVFGQGLKDALSGGATLLNEKQVKDAILALQAELKKKEADRRKLSAGDDADSSVLAAYNKRAGDLSSQGSHRRLARGAPANDCRLQVAALRPARPRLRGEGDPHRDRTERDSAVRGGAAGYQVKNQAGVSKRGRGTGSGE